MKSPQALLVRESVQLRLLPAAGLPTTPVVEYAGGVLFTSPVDGPTLGELIVQYPDRTRDLCARVLGTVAEGVGRVGTQTAAIEERSIPAVFLRKFNGLSGRAYLGQAGSHGAALTTLVSRLQRLHLAPTPGRPWVYGDLKPEHVLFPHGPEADPVFIDPGIARGRPQADYAKVLSRLFLGLFADPPPLPVVRQVAEETGRLIACATGPLSKLEHGLWLRELLMLWVMDAVNILSTYLTCPLVLPMPPHAAALAQRAPVLLDLLDEISVALAARRDPRHVWAVALAHLPGAVTS